MAVLKHRSSDREVVLPSRCLVGRSPLCNLALGDRSVSGEHSLLRWTGAGWEAQDLGSKNGTFLDNRRLDPGERAMLQVGSALGFGDAHNVWLLSDDHPPTVMATQAESGQIAAAKGELLALPDEQQPEVVLHPMANGQWVIERDGESRYAEDQMVITVRDQLWRLHLPGPILHTLDGPPTTASIEDLALRFIVSRDEEYIELMAQSGGRTLEFKPRSHHYLLLVLARARLADQRNGALDPSLHGWVHQVDLLPMLKIDANHLNISIFRARQQFIDAGIFGASRIVERRIGMRELRIGVARLSIVKQ